jgi:hypothetical protein
VQRRAPGSFDSGVALAQDDTPFDSPCIWILLAL